MVENVQLDAVLIGIQYPLLSTRVDQSALYADDFSPSAPRTSETISERAVIEMDLRTIAIPPVYRQRRSLPIDDRTRFHPATSISLPSMVKVPSVAIRG